MPVIMEGRLGQPLVRYDRFPLTAFYLHRAYDFAKAVSAAPEPGDVADDGRLQKAIAVILWSALALEAGANEFAEDVIPSGDLGDFDHARKGYHSPKGISRTIWKWHVLFKTGPKALIPLADPVLANAETLVQVRHQLSHYKPQDTARKIHYEAKPGVDENGRAWNVMWDFTQKPIRIEPSLLERQVLTDPARHFRATRALFLAWALKNGGDEICFNAAFPE